MNNKLVGLFLGLSLLAGACNHNSSGYSDAKIKLAGQVIQVDIASNESTRQLGLGGRQAMQENQGMWFVFDQSRIYTFWMKDMQFPIDIIWINSGKVVDITANAAVQPGATDIDLVRYSPSSSASRVLELNSGWASRHGLQVGDLVQY